MNNIKMDKILKNGKVYTLRKEGEYFSAIGIKDGLIEFVGTEEEIEKFDSDETIDLKGKTVIPGMGDSHLHLYAYCQNQASVQLDGAKSLEEMIILLKERAEITLEGQWIKGAGFDQTKFIENKLPTRWDLDKVSLEKPIVVRRCCLHVLVANSKAMELAGVNNKTPENWNGLVEVDDNGELTGIFRERSTIMFDDIVPNSFNDVSEKKNILISTMNDMASKGITNINTYAAKIWNYEEDINLYREIEKEGKLPIRVQVSLDTIFENDDKDEKLKDPFSKVKYGAYKLFTDGSLGARSAALNSEYSDDAKNMGILIDEENLKFKLLKAYELGLQPAIHAIGDRALDTTLEAIEYVISTSKVDEGFESNCKKRLPFRIIHAQIATEKQIERMKKLPVILDVQPIFLSTDLHWIESRLGKERVKTAYSWNTFTKAGLMLAGGSDCPVEAYDPLRGIYAAVTRQDFDGYPKEGWEPGEKLSIYEAVCMFSKNIAYTSGDENLMGTIEKGKFADLTIFQENPFESKESDLFKLKIWGTFVAGIQVFKAK